MCQNQYYFFVVPGETFYTFLQTFYLLSDTLPPKKGKDRGKRTQPDEDPPQRDEMDNEKGKGRGKRTQPDEEPQTQPDEIDNQDETQAYHSGHDSGDDEAASKKKKVPELEPSVEQALCEWFADHPLFYDMSDAGFKNRQRKDRLLDQKCKELDMSGKYLH